MTDRATVRPARVADRVRVPAVPPARAPAACSTTSPPGCCTAAGRPPTRAAAAAALERVGLAARASTGRVNCPAANGSAPRSRAPSPGGRPSCSPTNPPATSTPRPAPTSCRCSPAWPTPRTTVVVITHDPAVAARDAPPSAAARRPDRRTIRRHGDAPTTARSTDRGPSDALALGGSGLRARRVRSALSSARHRHRDRRPRRRARDRRVIEGQPAGPTRRPRQPAHRRRRANIHRQPNAAADHRRGDDRRHPAGHAR